MKCLRLCLVVLLGLSPHLCLAEPPEAANRKVVIQFVDALNNNDIESMNQLLSEEFGLAGIESRGPSGSPSSVPMRMQSFSDMNFKIENIIAEGDKLVAQVLGTGIHAKDYMGVGPTGRWVDYSSVEIFRIKAGKIVEHQSIPDHIGLLRQITGPGRAEIDVALLDVESITVFEPPAFLESVVVDENGEILISSLFESKIYRVGDGGTYEVFASFPLGQGPGLRGVFCLLLDGDKGLYVTVNSPEAEKHGLWRVDSQGIATHIAALPLDSVPNGIARHPDGGMLIADSAKGRVFYVAQPTAKVDVWLEHPLLAPRSYIGVFPGANGIQVNDNDVYVTNSDKNLLLHVSLLKDGRADEVRILAEDLGGDDFAVADDGTLYVTTHPFNTIVKIGPAGERRIIASSENGVTGPTAAVIHQQGNAMYLYVVTDGGFYSLPDTKTIPLDRQKPSLVRIKL